MKKDNKNKHEIVIKIEGKEWEDAIQEAYKKNNKKAKINGFRPGKAPFDVFVKQYGVESLYMDAADSLLQGAYLKALEDSKLVPVTQPSVDLKSIDKDGVEFKFNIITKPEVKISKYEGLKVKKGSTKVSKKEIEEEIDHLLEHYSELIIKDGKVENGDTAIIDYEGSVDGVPFEGGKADNYSLVIGSNTFIPGFEDQLIGMEKESTKDINVTFPEDYHAEELKGKEAVFKVTVHEIKTKEKRELDEEFFEDLQMEGVNSKETLEAEIKEHLEAHKKQEVETKFSDELLEAISKNTEVEIPEEMVEDEIDYLMHNFEHQLSHQGISLDLYYQFTKSTEKDLRNQLEKEAYKNVLYRLILDELIKELKIEVTDKEIDEKIEEISKQYNVSKEEILKEFGNDTANLKSDIQFRKTIDKLEELNK